MARSRAGLAGVLVDRQLDVYVILDNLSAHKNKDIRAWAAANRVTLLFTPTSASWANPVKAQFGPLRQFTIAHSNRTDHAEQTRDLHAYLTWRNANSRHPDVIAAQRRERARVRSEKGLRWEDAPAANSPSPHNNP